MTDNGTATGVELDAPISSPAKGRAATTRECGAERARPTRAATACPSSIRYPHGGKIAGGRDIDALTSYVDFMPTLLDLCGVEVPAGRTFHGRSLVPLLQRRRRFGLGRPRHRLRHPARGPSGQVAQERGHEGQVAAHRRPRALRPRHEDPGQRQDIAASASRHRRRPARRLR